MLETTAAAAVTDAIAIVSWLAVELELSTGTVTSPVESESDDFKPAVQAVSLQLPPEQLIALASWQQVPPEPVVHTFHVCIRLM